MQCTLKIFVSIKCVPMKDEKRKKHKVRRRVISYSCKKGKTSIIIVMQEDWDEHESMIEERCKETDVLIVKPEATRMRRMCGKKKIIKAIIEIGCFDKQVESLKEVLSTLELRDHLKSLGLDELIATKVQCFDNLTGMLVLSKTKGNVSNDKKSFQYSLLSSVVESPVVENEENLFLSNVDKKGHHAKGL